MRCERLLVGFLTGVAIRCELEHPKGKAPEAVTVLAVDVMACAEHAVGQRATDCGMSETPREVPSRCCAKHSPSARITHRSTTRSRFAEIIEEGSSMEITMLVDGMFVAVLVDPPMPSGRPA